MTAWGSLFMEHHLSSVKNSSRLLKEFLDGPKELGVTELSRRLQLSKGAVHKLLATLESDGFISQNPSTKQYSLGFTLLELGTKVLRDHNLVDFAKPYLQQLAEKTKELACLCVVDGKDAIYVDKIDSQHPIRFNVDAFRRFPLYATSASRVMLAFRPEAFIDSVLADGIRTYTPHSMQSPDEIKERLAAIRNRGYEISTNLRNVGVTGMAAPIRDATGEIVASVSLIGPSDRVVPQQDAFLQQVLLTTRNISFGLGYR